MGAALQRVTDQIRLEYGVAQTFCLKYATGRPVQSNFAGGRVMFTAVDERKLFLDDEDASDFERAVRDLGVAPSEDFIRVTKIRHPRGGGHSIRVERAEESSPSPSRSGATRLDPGRAARAAAPTREETLLAKSVDLAREHGAGAFTTQSEKPAAADYGIPNSVKITPASAGMYAALCAAIDAIVETQGYAERRGVPMTFSEESVRAIGLSIYISSSKAGAR